jgi:transposase
MIAGRSFQAQWRRDVARPSKLTPEAQAAIVDAVLHGCTYKDAAEAAGVWYTTFNDWMQKGAEAKSGQFHEFYEAVSKANAECAVNFTRVIQTAAAKGDAKYALEWLKRRRRAEWGDNVDVTTGGEKIVISIKGFDDITED